MRIVSWNVNGIRAGYRKGLFEFLEREKPDIFCIQETKARREQVSEEQAMPLGMHSFWSSAEKKGYSGTATFSFEKPQEIQHGIGIEKFDSEGRFVVTDFGPFILFNIYYPNGARGLVRHKYKMEFLKTVKKHFQDLLSAGKELIVLGDYNIAPTDIDIYDPQQHVKTSGFLPEEKQWFQEFLDMGFIDTYRYFYPDVKEKYTWWNQIQRARMANRGWRIDMICVSKGLEDKIQRAEIWDHVEGSDHCPIILDISC